MKSKSLPSSFLTIRCKLFQTAICCVWLCKSLHSSFRIYYEKAKWIEAPSPQERLKAWVQASSLWGWCSCPLCPWAKPGSFTESELSEIQWLCKTGSRYLNPFHMNVLVLACIFSKQLNCSCFVRMCKHFSISVYVYKSWSQPSSIQVN